MKYNTKEIIAWVIIAVAFIILLLDIFGIIDSHIPGWIIKQIGIILS